MDSHGKERGVEMMSNNNINCIEGVTKDKILTISPFAFAMLF